MVRKQNNKKRKVQKNNRHNKKAQGLSMNVIILAALGIIVLAILAFLIYSNAKGFGAGLNDIKKPQCSDPLQEEVVCPNNCEQVFVTTSSINKMCCDCTNQGA